MPDPSILYHIGMNTENTRTKRTKPATHTATKESRKRRPPRKIRCREAVENIRLLAVQIRDAELRRSVAQMARSLARARKERHEFDVEERLEALIASAGSSESAGDRHAACEAAAWALAWLARSRRAAGSSGALLQKLVRMADACAAGLSEGNTQAAAFVFVLAGLFQDVEACRRLGDVATASVEQDLCRLVPPGCPIRLTGSEAIVSKVSEWSRFLDAAARLGTGRGKSGGSVPWNATAQEAFGAAVETAVRLLGASGRALGLAGRLRETVSSPIVGAARVTGDKRLVRTIDTILQERSVHEGKGGAILPRDLLIEKQRFAILRTGWGPRDIRLLVDARSPSMHLEIAVGDRLIVAGPWEWSVAADGIPLEAEGPWQESCHESDEKASFLEWTLPLSGGLQLERQIVLSPEDRVAVLSDTVVPRLERLRTAPAGEKPITVAIEYRGSWNACEGIGLEHAEETREVIGFDTAMRFMALPLALPEWTTGGGQGSFEPSSHRLVLRQRSAIARLHAPVWFDFEPRRIGGPLTWRQLSVADTRQNLPVHRACGYRVQAGSRQWLVYRALDSVRNRSVLGCNLACEFLLGRIGKDGMVERLIEIQ